jgi:hypothetical protein
METRKEPRARDLANAAALKDRPPREPRERPRLAERADDAADALDLWDNVPV